MSSKAVEKKLKVGYVIGNGLSRKGFDLNELDDCITTGCNRIYKKFEPTYVVAIDRWMEKSPVAAIERIINKKPDKKNPRKWKFVTRKMIENLWWMTVEDEPVTPEIALNRGYCHNSGMYGALLLAQVQQFDVVYLLGIDFFRDVRDEDGDIIPNELFGGTSQGSSGMIKVWNHMFEGAPTGHIEGDQVVVKDAIPTKFIRVGPIEDCDRDFYDNEIKNLEYIDFADMPICKM
jgi:hypothetical protein